MYFDYQSTTPLDPRVFEEMKPYFLERFGNPASRTHEQGWMAEAAVEKARRQVASLIGATEREVVFTSGATESNNLALKGVARAHFSSQKKRGHIVTSCVEHSAVLEPLRSLQREGFDVSFVKVDETGRVSPEDVQKAIRPDTILVSIMAANNEVGTVQPIREISKICREAEVLFHTDAAQALGKMSLDVQRDGIDLLSASAHKIYGPKGSGFLFVRRKDPRVTLLPEMDGGGHERGLRSGTINVPGVVGLGAACEWAEEFLEKENTEIAQKRDFLWKKISSSLSGVWSNGNSEFRVSGNLSIGFEGVEAEPLLLDLREFCLASGAACASAKLQPSYVLKEMGLDSEKVKSCIRISLGRFTTQEEVEFLATRMVESVKKLRDLSPEYVPSSLNQPKNELEKKEPFHA